MRTYPVATAGTPGPLSFDPATGEMRYSYSPRDLGAPTVVAVSDVHYPTGYEAVVGGGRVTSAPGAGRITIEADPGAARVEVTVRRARTAAPSTTAEPAPVELPATGAAAASWPWAVLAALALAGVVRPRSR